MEGQPHFEPRSPAVLRYNVMVDMMDYPAVNSGASEGGTFDHVVFPIGRIRAYLNTRDPSRLAAESRSKLDVAITRARHSVVFVTQ